MTRFLSKQQMRIEEKKTPSRASATYHRTHKQINKIHIVCASALCAAAVIVAKQQTVKKSIKMRRCTLNKRADGSKINK